MGFDPQHCLWGVHMHRSLLPSRCQRQQGCDCTGTLIWIIKTLCKESQLLPFCFPGWIGSFIFSPLQCSCQELFLMFLQILDLQIWLNETCLSSADSKHARFIYQIWIIFSVGLEKCLRLLLALSFLIVVETNNCITVPGWKNVLIDLKPRSAQGTSSR